MQQKSKAGNTVLLSRFFTKYGTLVGLIVLCAVFTVLRPKTFPTVSNLLTVLRQIAMLSILGAGLTVVMITKRSDLSIGYGTSFMGIMVAAFMVHYRLPVYAAIPLTLLLGAFMGLCNGALVAIIGVPDFIATLAVGFLMSGLNQAYTKGHPISNLPNGFAIFGSKAVYGVPFAIVIMLLFLIFVYVLLNHTRFGRYVHGIGGNQEATMLSGVNVTLNQILAYVVSGVGVAIAAIVLTSRLGTAHPQSGDNLLMDAIATVYVGGTAFKEGDPNIAGTFIGALIIGVLANGLTLMNVKYYNQDIAKGVVILLAVTITSLQRMRKK